MSQKLMIHAKNYSEIEIPEKEIIFEKSVRVTIWRTTSCNFKNL